MIADNGITTMEGRDVADAASEQASITQVLDGDSVPEGLTHPPVQPEDTAASQVPVGEDDGQ